MQRLLISKLAKGFMTYPYKMTYQINNSQDGRAFISYEFFEKNGVIDYTSEISIFEDDALDECPSNGSTICLGKKHSMNPAFLRKMADIIENITKSNSKIMTK